MRIDHLPAFGLLLPHLGADQGPKPNHGCCIWMGHSNGVNCLNAFCLHLSKLCASCVEEQLLADLHMDSITLNLAQICKPVESRPLCHSAMVSQ